MPPEFKPYGKTTRLESPCVITEKIDGTNGVIYVDDDGFIWAGSRNRWVTRGDDNYGFANWVADNAQGLAYILGPGYHYGEWWGAGIQRGYGILHKRFSLFDTLRYSEMTDEEATDALERVPNLGLVPLLAVGNFSDEMVLGAEALLKRGSLAAPGYKHPEGLVIRFTQNRVVFKVVLDKAGPKVERPPSNRPPKRKWTQEEIDAARSAAAERQATA